MAQFALMPSVPANPPVTPPRPTPGCTGQQRPRQVRGLILSGVGDLATLMQAGLLVAEIRSASSAPCDGCEKRSDCATGLACKAFWVYATPSTLKVGALKKLASIMSDGKLREPSRAIFQQVEEGE